MEANQLAQSEWEEVVTHLERMLQSIKFGSITLVVQDGKVIQIEKNEKVRLQKK
ncbi:MULTISPECIES: YezD family protein [Bacillaceae]|uniref:YezD family protein n=1 Tax=Bacillaceae TaxID=186817 RepID=UPI0009EA010B|nr:MULTISPECIES: YezD family protein [Bacillaceae]